MQIRDVAKTRAQMRVAIRAARMSGHDLNALSICTWDLIRRARIHLRGSPFENVLSG